MESGVAYAAPLLKIWKKDKDIRGINKFILVRIDF